MRKSEIFLDDFSFVDPQHSKLSLNAQESLKERLLSNAKARAVHDGFHIDISNKVHEYYYDELAFFMQSHPQVLIDLTLIKLEED